MADKQLRGQDITIRIVQGGVVVTEINKVGSFNDDLQFAIMEDGFLGQKTQEYDEVLNGYRGNFEFQVNTATWMEFELAVERRARGEDPSIVFNVIRIDQFKNGSSAVVTYSDVSWGPFAKGSASRTDPMKVRAEFATSKRNVVLNQLI